MRRPRHSLLVLLFAFAFVLPLRISRAHDIPNARVDRSIQVTLSPGRLAVDYEVSLAELTLTRDLRDLIGTLPDGDRGDWFDRYGKETAPLNAKGLLVTINQGPLLLRPIGFNLLVEEHPRYTFHFQAALPPRGRLRIQDTNFVSSEGTSRLAVRGRDGVNVRGDSLPTEVEQIPIQPIWLMSDQEERRSKQVEVEFEPLARLVPDRPTPPVPAPATSRSPAIAKGESVRANAQEPTRASRASDQLSRLLDRRSGISLLGLLVIAFGLGAAHAVQPGHGKTLVAATVVSEGGSPIGGVLLALTITATHTGSVLLVALGLWLTRSTRYESLHSALTFAAGFAIAAIGCWRLGRFLAGYREHERSEAPSSAARGGNILGLGIAGGLVPCWDAVALIILAEAVGRLAVGVLLLVAFGLGMATTLIVVGWAAARCRRALERWSQDERVEAWLGIAGSLVLTAIGLYLLSLA